MLTSLARTIEKETGLENLASSVAWIFFNGCPSSCYPHGATWPQSEGSTGKLLPPIFWMTCLVVRYNKLQWLCPPRKYQLVAALEQSNTSHCAQKTHLQGLQKTYSSLQLRNVANTHAAGQKIKTSSHVIPPQYLRCHIDEQEQEWGHLAQRRL